LRYLFPALSHFLLYPGASMHSTELKYFTGRNLLVIYW
jgi:hypothetical protein